MTKKYFIRHNNIIMGPFERQILINMLNSGKLRMSDTVSLDKQIWTPLQSTLGLIVPERAVTKETSEPSRSFIPPPPAAPAPVKANDQDLEQDEEECLDQLKWQDMLLNVIASLGNGSGYLHRLNQYSGNAMLAAGVAAAGFGIVFVLLGGIMFGNCYNVSRVALTARCLIVVLLAGVFFWIANTCLRLIAAPDKKRNSVEADFLSAMHGMMNIGVISVVLNATAFIFNQALFKMSILQIAAVIAVAMLPLIFFSANTILSLRMNLMGNANLRPGISSLLAITGFYLVVIFSAVLLYSIYKFA